MCHLLPPRRRGKWDEGDSHASQTKNAQTNCKSLSIIRWLQQATIAPNKIKINIDMILFESVKPLIFKVKRTNQSKRKIIEEEMRLYFSKTFSFISSMYHHFFRWAVVHLRRSTQSWQNSLNQQKRRIQRKSNLQKPRSEDRAKCTKERRRQIFR